MTLVAPGDRLEKVGQDIVATTERYRGYVLSSSLGTGEDESGGTYELRVPAADLRDALREGADVEVPDAVGRPAWAAVSPPRGGWAHAGDVDAEAVRSLAASRGRATPPWSAR